MMSRKRVAGRYSCGCVYGPIDDVLKEIKCPDHDQPIQNEYEVPPVRKHIINVPRKDEQ